MNADTGQTEFTGEELDKLRGEVVAVKEAKGASWAGLQGESGIAKSTLSAFASDTYTGDNNKVAASVARWLRHREVQAKERSQIPRSPDFQPTRTSERLLSIMRYTQASGEFSIVGAAPGIGKTATAKQYQANNPRVWRATMAPSTRGVNTCLIELLEAMGEEGATGTPQALSRRVRKYLKEPGGLILIDEAQHLSEQAIEELRAIHDAEGVGIVLLGNDELYAKFNGAGRKAAFAQVTSRIGMRHKQARPDPADVKVLSAAWGVDGKGEEIDFLQAIAKKPGGLRGVDRTMKLATMMAAGEGDQRGIGHIRDAWSQLSDDPRH